MRRVVGSVVLGSALLVVSSCSDDESGSSSTEVAIQPSSYQERPAATTTSVPVDTTPTVAGRSPVEQSYIVGEGDNPSQIAALYDVDLDALRNYNGWASDYSDFPAVDGVVRIPPDAKFIDPNATTTAPTEEDEDADATATTEGTGEAVTEREDGDCSQVTYVVEEGDNPSTIASKFDVTLEALTAANGWDAEYSNFQAAGENVIIPPGQSCTETT